jgi:photosystem II stability/assembly factor-like uncharacterized protein
MRFKKTHIIIAVIIILFLNATSIDSFSQLFTSNQEPNTNVAQAQPLESDPYQSQGSDLQDFDLITEQEGWVLLGHNIYWTIDGGQNWENISPAGLQPSGIRGAAFLDTLNGWMVFANANEAGEYDYSIARTFDRGRSWQVNKLSLFSAGDPDGFGDAIYLQFLDEKTGYLVVRRATSTNFRVGTLFKTTDGGLSWTRLAIPIGEPVQFTTETTGWVAGGASGEELYQTQDGGRSWARKQINTPLKGAEKRLYRLPVFESEDNGLLPVVISDGNNSRVEYYITTNRGNSWKLMDSLPVGKGIYNGSDVPLSIFNNREWMLVIPNSRSSIKSIQKEPGVKNAPVNQVTEKSSTPEILITPHNPVTPEETATNLPTDLPPTETPVVQAFQDTGTTETPLAVTPEVTPEITQSPEATLPPGESSTPEATTTALPSATLAPTETSPPAETTEETEIVTVQSGQPLAEAIRELDMASTSAGWAKTMQGNCQTIDAETPVNCSLSVNLLRTVDGGETWEALQLPENTSFSLASYVQNTNMYLGQGFDSCSMPTTTLMQDWIVNSPYRVWNLYIGGSSRAGCGTLTASYIQALAQQGWKFIITWVGPQAACTTFTTRMSYDPTTAYNQGISEANMAIDRAFELGLTNPDKTGALIYYDLESYNTNDTKCREAAKRFMDGWSKQLKAKGNLSGVYGSPCSSAMSDFASNPNVPDTVWLAAWISPYQYRSSVSLTNLSCISNTLWANQQRMRQYSGSHREAWGSSVLSSIDSNVIDSPVSVLDKNSSCPQSGGVLLYWNNTYSCTNSSGNAGYQLYANKGFNNLPAGFNDQAASLRVPTGWSARLYQDANRGGGSICYNTNVVNLANEGNFPGTNVPINKQVSSVEVFDNPSCSANPAPAPTGGYWSATYFNDSSLSAQCAVDTTSGPFLLKDWGTGSPNSKCNADYWSGRFTQTVRFQTGTYTFNLGADNRGRLKIGSETIIDRWSTTTTSSAVRALSAGDYVITVEYAELTNSARVAAWWTGPGYIAPRQTRDNNQWYAQYWGNTSQWWDSIVRVNEGTGPLNRQWGLGSPGYGLPSDKFSARYQRDVTLECGTYNFNLTADDGVRFYVDNQLYLDQWKDQAATYSVPVTLSAGTHALRVDYYDNLGAAQLSLDWTRTAGCSGVPTATVTKPPATATFTPPPTATKAPPTATMVPPTATKVPPTATKLPPTATSTAALADVIFKDGFESGSFSAWSYAVTGSGDLSVTTAAALVGSRGMQVRINDNNYIRVQRNMPSLMPRLRARFYLHPNNLSMAENDNFMIFITQDSVGARNLAIEMRRFSGKYQVRGAIRDNAALFVYTPWADLSSTTQAIEIDARAASSAGVSDGYITLWVDGTQAATLTGIANSSWAQKRILIGAAFGIDTGTRGTLYMDLVEVRSSSYIGLTSDPVKAPTTAPTATLIAPTATKAPPTATFIAPTATKIAPTATSPAALSDVIFKDGFESGSFSAWSYAITGSGDLSVTTAAALVGNRGMQVRINDNNYIRVQRNMPSLMPRLRARFYLHPNNLSMAENDNFMIFITQDSVGARNLAIEMRRFSGKYQVRGAIRDNAALFVYTPWADLSGTTQAIEIDARAASSAGVSDGYITLWVDGTQAATLTGIANSSWAQKRILIGAAFGIDTGTRGTFYMDLVEVRSSSYIGLTSDPLKAPTTAPTATLIAPTATPTRTPTKAPTQTPTSKPADQLFADSFENGNLSSWTSSLTDAGNLSVSTTAALVGSRGMQAHINDNNALYVHTTLPSSQTRYRMRFYFHPNSLQMAEGDLFNIYNAYNSAGSTNIMIRMRRNLGNYQLQVAARDNSSWVLTGWYTITNTKQYIEIDWKSATSASYNNGFLYFYLNGSVKTSLALYNSSWSVARDRLGVVDGARTGTRGTIYFDHFESRKSTYIGP